VIDKLSSSSDSFLAPPLRLDESEVPVGATQCDDFKAIECARIALSYLQHADSGFPGQFFPKPQLHRGALLGTHTVHYRNFEYHSDSSLQLLMENKINSATSRKLLIAVLAHDKYYCFKVEKFTYSLLDELKEKTFAIDFLLMLPDVYGGFVFFEDGPACFMFFQERAEFEKGFMSPEIVMKIYTDHMMEWRHYRSDHVTAWMQLVKSAMESCVETPED